MTSRRRLIGALSAAALSLLLAAAPALASAAQPYPARTAVSAAGPRTANGSLVHWQQRPTGTDLEHRGLAAVSASTAWVAGAGGSVLRTTDAGRHWTDVSPFGAAGLEFRDVEAFSATSAVVLAIGPGTASQILVTHDSGKHWATRFVATDKHAFYDCMTFFDPQDGLAMSDPVNGRFRILATDDGARTWHVLPARGMPRAQTGEFGFAASGTCIAAAGTHDAYLASGGGTSTRVYRSTDRGRTWSAVRTPIASGPSAGIYSLAFRGPTHGIAIGGDYTTPRSAPDSLALTADGGRHWTLRRSPINAYRSGVAWAGRTSAIAVGPTGSDLTLDAGRTWTRFDYGSLDVVQCVPGACWGAGVDGRATYLSLR